MALACADYGVPPTGPGGGGGGIDSISFAADIRDTLLVRCAAVCHSSTFHLGGVNMGSVTWAEIRAVSGDSGGLVIVPGNSSASNLYLKTTATPPFGFRMPNDGIYLSLETQTAIRDWIDQGALDK